MRSISVRPLIQDDIAPMAAWMVQYPLWARYGLTESRARDIMERGLAGGDVLLTADTDESAACGFAYVLPRGAFALSPYLRWLAVRQDMTGTGVGLALLQAAEQESIHTRAELSCWRPTLTPALSVFTSATVILALARYPTM
ncbi:MAG: GNAT family N-acetyltransferase [Chloroflexi bacterium]|nr:GNAT family N-acetyltransferase [Chloroflexota bacterium]